MASRWMKINVATLLGSAACWIAPGLSAQDRSVVPTTEAQTFDLGGSGTQSGEDGIRLGARLTNLTESALAFERRNLVADVFEYTVIVRVGPGEWDKIGIHRVVREQTPMHPVSTDKAVMMLHGDASNFRTAFLMSAQSTQVPRDQSLAIYLAQNNVDVWGIDLRWTFVPDTVTDFSFMGSWDTGFHLEDIRRALKLARLTRGLTGSGFGKMHMLGHSRGGQFAYAYANAETQLPMYRRDLKGLIPVDIAYKYSPDNENLRLDACTRYAVFQEMFDSGVYYSDEAYRLRGLAQLAAFDPDGESPVIPGFTNKQAALFVISATYSTYTPPLSPPTPFYHFFGGTFDETGLPSGLSFSNYGFVLDFAFSVPGYQSLGEILDGEAIACGSPDLPYDDHLAQVTLPVLNVGAAGGFGEYGTYSTTLLGSTDVTNVQVALLPPEAAAVDFGHADLLLGDNAKDLAWTPVLSWIQTH